MPKFPTVPFRAVLKKVPSGEIALELGGDGVYLRFDCECLDALPYCKASCCSLPGIDVEESELVNEVSVTVDGKKKTIKLDALVERTLDGDAEMHRASDGFCRCLNRESRTCGIYKDRPEVCREFHCTRGAGMRGWILDLKRQISED